MPTAVVPVIRIATPEDIPALIQLQTQIWEPTYRATLSPEQITYMFDWAYSPQSLLDQMTGQGHIFVVAQDEQADFQGFASFSQTDTPDVFKLQKIYILPRTQGSGLGRALLAEVETRVRALDGHTLRLNVNRYNPARTFYERQGFAVIREEDVPVGPYWMNDFVMEKVLKD